MLYRYPDYFDQFSCVADKCPCTCCGGWSIEIDEDSLEKYREMNIQTVDFDEYTFFLDSKKRCVNLNEKGLCKLIIQHGEDILCDTCRMFPRHVEEFEGIREYSLSISCPEVAHMLLNRQGPLNLIVMEDDLADGEAYDADEQEVYGQLVGLRDDLLEILFSKNRKLSFQCREILKQVADFQNEWDGIDTSEGSPTVSLEDVFNAMTLWEYTSDEFPNMIKQVKDNWMQMNMQSDPLEYLDDTKQEEQLRQIILYFIFVCFCGSSYDEYYYGMVQMAVCAAIHIKMFWDAHKLREGSIMMEDMEQYTYMYARELEHSIPNVLAMEKWMDEHRIV